MNSSEKITYPVVNPHNEDAFKNFFLPALQSTNLVLWRWDLQTNIIDSTFHVTPFLNFSEGFYTVSFDYFMDRVYYEDRAYLKQTLQHAISTGEKCHAEFRYLHEDTPLRWFAADCHIVVRVQGYGNLFHTLFV
ncbi:MAG: PAS domain-containing protein [Armatimonadetes bacterium]|nr:PAS domain-containing protein [Armatimonadota bacterium]